MKRLLTILRGMRRFFAGAEDRLLAYSLEELSDGDARDGARGLEVALAFAEVRASLDGLIAALGGEGVVYDSGEDVKLTSGWGTTEEVN